MTALFFLPLLISVMLALCNLTYSDSSDTIFLPSDEFSNQFFNDESTMAMSPEPEYGSAAESDGLDFLAADQSDACETGGNSQTINQKRAREECKMPSSSQSPLDFPPQLNIDPLDFLDPTEFLAPEPGDLSLVYPFELPDDNYEICPKPASGRLYAVCDSGIQSDNKFDERSHTFNLRYCTLYNRLLGCVEPHHLWCCEYYYLDTLGVDSGIVLEGVGIGRYCQSASFLRFFGLPIPKP